MKDSSVLQNSELSVNLFDNIRVAPTSSARTVQISNFHTPDYIKLHYERVLGRINRSMPLAKTLAGLEASSMIQEAMNVGRLNDQFWILPEIGGIVASLPFEKSTVEWGMIWRSQLPIGNSTRGIAHMLPLFSLFSVDRLTPYDPPLLCEIIQASGKEAKEFLLSDLIAPIIRSYVQLITLLGLQPEWHAQNLLLALDHNFEVLGVVMRDLTDLEKDLTIRRLLGLSSDFESYPYKCISVEDGELYRIRHSFAFDFKLGDYVFEPLSYTVAQEYGYDLEEIRASIKNLNQEFLQTLPSDFFPSDGLCYKHEKIALTGERPYVTQGRPRFR